MLKIYEDIINEVISKLEQAEGEASISKSATQKLGSEWRERLIEYTQGEWGGESRDGYEQRYRVHEGFSDRAKEAFDGRQGVEKGRGGFEDYGSSEVSSCDSEIIGGKDNTGNCMVCLYVKVNMSKGKWKCVFKQGFISIGNIDFVFNSAQGELEW